MSSPSPHSHFRAPSSQEIAEWVASGQGFAKAQEWWSVQEKALLESLSVQEQQEYLKAKVLVAQALASESQPLE